MHRRTRARWIACLVGGVWFGGYAAVLILAQGVTPLMIACTITSAACLITYDVARTREPGRTIPTTRTEGTPR